MSDSPDPGVSGAEALRQAQAVRLCINSGLPVIDPNNPPPDATPAGADIQPDPGMPGRDGRDGRDGLPGVPGATGPQGEQGLPGL